MIIDSYIGEALTIAGTTAAALTTIALLLRKFSGFWKSTGAENSLVTLLHTELTRLSGHNATLMGELEKLHREVIKLSNEMYLLTQENQNLHGEVSQLTQEVSRLQSLIKDYQGSGKVV